MFLKMQSVSFYIYAIVVVVVHKQLIPCKQSIVSIREGQEKKSVPREGTPLVTLLFSLTLIEIYLVIILIDLPVSPSALAVSVIVPVLPFD